MEMDCQRAQILFTLKAYGPVNEVRLIRDKVTGESRGFAFVDFPSVEDATRFMEYHNMRLELDGRIVYMDYSRQKEPHSGGAPEHKDWICPQVSRPSQPSEASDADQISVFDHQLCAPRRVLHLPSTKTSESSPGRSCA